MLPNRKRPAAVRTLKIRLSQQIVHAVASAKFALARLSIIGRMLLEGKLQASRMWFRLPPKCSAPPYRYGTVD